MTSLYGYINDVITRSKNKKWIFLFIKKEKFMLDILESTKIVIEKK